MDNYYELLEVNEKASKEIINKIFKMHIKKNHPDLYQGEEKKLAEEKLKKLNEAYEILSDDIKREEYDRKLSEEKELVQSELEQEIDYLKNELIKKQEIINNMGLKLGMNFQDNNDDYNEDDAYYGEDEYKPEEIENGQDYYNDIEENKTVTSSYLKDIKAFILKVIFAIIKT